jgi:hypothetical protein
MVGAVVVWDVNLGVVMANIVLARDPKRETVSAAAVAERLCVVVFQNGKVGGRYAATRLEPC